MALLWETFENNTHYQVKKAGHSVRLYSNGVFHSQWNAQSPIVGQLWESLFLPALFLKKVQALNILVLGVGGGAVVNLLNYFFKAQRITGIELDPVHLKVAKRWFESNKSNVHYYCDDAVTWLNAYRGPKFDLIIEDLFMSDPNGEVLRAVAADDAWMKSLARHIKPDGVLAMNFESIRQASRCWRKSGTGSGFQYAGLFTSMRNENAIAAFSRIELNVRSFKEALYTFPELDIRKSSCKLDYKYRKLPSLSK